MPPSMLQRKRLCMGRAIERRIHGLQKAIHVLCKIVIPEANDAIACRFQPARPSIIFQLACVEAVLGAVEFDHEARSHAREINDIRPCGNLAAEMRAIDIDGAQAFPEQRLGLRSFHA